MSSNELDELDLTQLDYLTGDFIHASHDLYSLLCQPRFERWRTPTLEDDALDLYAEGRAIGESLPFSTLVIYISAFADILQEHLKNS